MTVWDFTSDLLGSTLARQMPRKRSVGLSVCPSAMAALQCRALANENHILAATAVLLALSPAEREAAITADADPEGLRRILLHGQQLLDVAESLRSREGWKLVGQDKGVDTLLQTVEGSPLKRVRVEGVVSAPLPHVFALLNEFDLWP